MTIQWFRFSYNNGRQFWSLKNTPDNIHISLDLQLQYSKQSIFSHLMDVWRRKQRKFQWMWQIMTARFIIYHLSERHYSERDRVSECQPYACRRRKEIVDGIGRVCTAHAAPLNLLNMDPPLPTCLVIQCSLHMLWDSKSNQIDIIFQTSSTFYFRDISLYLMTLGRASKLLCSAGWTSSTGLCSSDVYGWKSQAALLGLVQNQLMLNFFC